MTMLFFLVLFSSDQSGLSKGFVQHEDRELIKAEELEVLLFSSFKWYVPGSAAGERLSLVRHLGHSRRAHTVMKRGANKGKGVF